MFKGKKGGKNYGENPKRGKWENGKKKQKQAGVIN